MMITSCRRAIASAGLLGACLLGGLVLWSCNDRVPRDLPALAAKAEAAGYRVVPTGKAGLRDGFYALPPGDGRGREDLAGLSRWLPGWGGAVVATPTHPNEGPVVPTVYVGPGWQISGEPDAVRAFARAVGVR